MAERTEAMTAASAPRHVHDGSYVDWPALIAGGVVASAIGLLFAGFGASLGLSAVSAQPGQGSGTFALILTGAWLLITTIAAFMAGGYIAGRMRRRMDGASADEVTARDSIHGIVVWALGLLIGGWLAAGVVGSAATAVGNVAQAGASAIGGVAQGAATLAGGAASAVGNAAAAVGGSNLPDGVTVNPLDIINQRLLRGTGVQVDQNPQLPDNTMAVLADVVRTGEINPDDKAFLAQAVAQNTNLTPDQANQRIDQAVAQVQDVRKQAADKVAQLQQQAKDAADAAAAKARDAADAARKAAVLTGFVATAGFLIAFAAAIWGAAIGGRHRDEGRLFAGFRTF